MVTKKVKSQEKTNRLKQALRANLQKRKAAKRKTNTKKAP